MADSENLYESDEELEDETDDEGGEEYDTEYHPSVAWDLEAGDFVRDGANRLIECEGRDAYAVWCIKMACTQRNAHLAYMEEITGYDLGADMEEALEYSDQSSVETAIEDAIREALEVNPRTEYVGDFSFVWEGDDVHVSFVVKGIDWDEKIAIGI